MVSAKHWARLAGVSERKNVLQVHNTIHLDLSLTYHKNWFNPVEEFSFLIFFLVDATVLQYIAFTSRKAFFASNLNQFYSRRILKIVQFLLRYGVAIANMERNSLICVCYILMLLGLQIQVLVQWNLKDVNVVRCVK